MFPDELVVIGVHSAKFSGERDTAHLRQAVMRQGIDHPVVNDAGHEIWQQYAVRAWPTLVVVDPEQRIVETLSGEVSAEQMAEIIRPIMEFRVTSSASCSSLQPSVPAGRSGMTR